MVVEYCGIGFVEVDEGFGEGIKVEFVSFSRVLVFVIVFNFFVVLL